MRARAIHCTLGLLAACTLLVPTVALTAPRAGTFTTIDVPDALSTRAFGINDAGDVVGTYTDAAGKSHGFLLSDGRFTTIDVPGAGRTVAFRDQSQRQIVGRYSTPDAKLHGFLLDHGTFTTLDFPGGHAFTLPVKINAKGTIVGCYHDVDTSPFPDMHGWTKGAGDYTSYRLLRSMHNGITRDGRQIAGLWYEQSGVAHAYVLRDGRFLRFDYPGSIGYTGAWDIAIVRSARGLAPAAQIVGFYGDAAGHFHGFSLLLRGDERKPQRFASIDVPDSRRTEAYGVNAAGTVVGLYVDASNKTHGFLLRK